MANEELIERLSRTSVAGSNYLKEALSKALGVLADEGTGDNQEIVQGIETPNNEDSIEQYKKIFSEISEEFNGLFQSLESIRSSYLPYSFVADAINQNSGQTESLLEISSQESLKESYENAFFRMLGLPSTADLEDDVELICVDTRGNIERLKKDEYTRSSLDARQVEVGDRDTSVPIEVYNLIQNPDPIQVLVESGYDENRGEDLDKPSDRLVKTLEILKELYDLGTTRGKEAQQLAQGKLLASIVKVPDAELNEPGRIRQDKLQEDIFNFTSNFKEENDGDEDPNFRSSFKQIITSIVGATEPTYPEIGVELRDAIFAQYIFGIERNTIGTLDQSPNFWRYCSLLFPPVQDGRIAKCINEPEAIVAEPFLPETMRKVNSKKMRSSLLEAIIRIRLDIVTGTSNLRLSDFSRPAFSFGSDNPNGVRYNDIAENYGILEAYLVARLFNSFSGIASFTKENIKQMLIQQSNTGLVPAQENKTAKQTDGSAANAKKKEDSPEVKRLKAIKAIDDSMLLLLGENNLNKALDLQENVARSSSVHDAHLMEIVTAAVTYPSKWTDKKLKEIEERNLADARTKLDKNRSKIDKTMGRSKGVGVIDIMSYVIAMFSVEEKVLLSLLNERQFSYLKKEFPKDFFNDTDRIEISSAVNLLSSAAYDAYELFRSILSDKQVGGLFIYDD